MVERVGFARGRGMDLRDEFYIPEEMAEWIAQKKSELLSKLISNMGATDIGFEEFHKFDQFLPGTISEPDRAYEQTMDAQLVRTFIRTYASPVPFHQVVIGTLLDEQEKNSVVFIPILAFVTKDEALVRSWSVGDAVVKPDLN